MNDNLRVLTAQPEGLFSRDLILTEGGEPIGRINGRFWGDTVDLQIGGREYLMKSSWSARRIELIQADGGRVVAHAERERFFSRHYVLRSVANDGEGASGPELRLKFGLWLRNFTVMLGKKQIGVLELKGMTGRKTVARTPPGMPLELVVLLMFIARTTQRRS